MRAAGCFEDYELGWCMIEAANNAKQAAELRCSVSGSLVG